MNSNRVISSLCYFSIFFAGFIFPIAVYFISNDPEVKGHAKSALFSHFIPLITVPIFLMLLVSSPFISNGVAFGMLLLLIVVFIIVNLGVMIWNIVKGIKVLKN